jgi:hypothetical protein
LLGSPHSSPTMIPDSKNTPVLILPLYVSISKTIP